MTTVTPVARRNSSSWAPVSPAGRGTLSAPTTFSKRSWRSFQRCQRSRMARSSPSRIMPASASSSARRSPRSSGPTPLAYTPPRPYPAGVAELRAHQTVARGDDVVEHDAIEPAPLEIEVGLLRALVEHDVEPGHGCNEVVRQRAPEGADATPPQVRQLVHGTVL